MEFPELRTYPVMEVGGFLKEKKIFSLTLAPTTDQFKIRKMDIPVLNHTSLWPNRYNTYLSGFRSKSTKITIADSKRYNGSNKLSQLNRGSALVTELSLSQLISQPQSQLRVLKHVIERKVFNLVLSSVDVIIRV